MEVWGPQRNHILIRSHHCAYQSSISNFGNGGVGIRGGSHTRGLLSHPDHLLHSGLTSESTVTYSIDSTSQAGQQAVDQEMDREWLQLLALGKRFVNVRAEHRTRTRIPVVLCFLPSGDDLCPLRFQPCLPFVYTQTALSPYVSVYLPTYLSTYLPTYPSIHTCTRGSNIQASLLNKNEVDCWTIVK